MLLSLGKALPVFLPVLLWLFILYYLSEQFQKLQFKTLGFKAALILSAPGVVIHELSHLLACILTATPVGKVSLFAPRETPPGSGNYTLGYVEHQKPNFLAQIIITLAPFFGVSGFMALLLKLFFPGLSLNYAYGGGIPDYLLFQWTFFKAFFLSFKLLDFKLYLFLYLMVAVLPGAAPSRTDLAPFFKSLLYLGVALLLFFWFFRLLGVFLSPGFIQLVINLLGLISSWLSISIACSLLGIWLLLLIAFFKS